MDDDKIKSFFRDMKAADEHRPVPPFPEQKEPRKILPVYLYAAAAAVVAILITVRYVLINPTTPSKTEIIIQVGDDPLESHSLVDYGHEDLSDWESPTSFLSEYY